MEYNLARNLERKHAVSYFRTTFLRSDEKILKLDKRGTFQFKRVNLDAAVFCAVSCIVIQKCGWVALLHGRAHAKMLVLCGGDVIRLLFAREALLHGLRPFTKRESNVAWNLKIHCCLRIRLISVLHWAWKRTLLFKLFRGVCCMSNFSSEHRMYLLFLERALRRSFDVPTVSSESAWKLCFRC